MTPKLTPSQEHNQRIAREKAKKEQDSEIAPLRKPVNSGEERVEYVDPNGGTILGRYLRKTGDAIIDYAHTARDTYNYYLHRFAEKIDRLRGDQWNPNYPPQAFQMDSETEQKTEQKAEESLKRLCDRYIALRGSRHNGDNVYTQAQEAWKIVGEGKWDIYLSAARYAGVDWGRGKIIAYLKKQGLHPWKRVDGETKPK